MIIIRFPVPSGSPRPDDLPIPATILPFPATADGGEHVRDDQAEPSTAELSAIDREMPLIRAEMDLVEAEIRVLTAHPHPSELDWRRLRRAKNRVAREAIAHSANRLSFALVG